MLKRILIIALVVGVIGVIIHDASAYASAQRRLRDATYDLATSAASRAHTTGRDEVASGLAKLATERGVVVYQYGQSDQSVQVWAETAVGDTLVVGTVYNLFAGMPFAEARTSDFIIRDYREAGIQ